MKTTELRIGNWVKRDVQLDGFQIDSHSFFVCERDSEMYNPIPLTEQWLKDFGIDKPKGIHNSTFSGLISIKKDNVGWCFYIGNIHIKYIKYVHQLQNLYFALTETELERFKKLK